MHNVHQESLLHRWFHVPVIGNEKDIVLKLPTAVSAMAVKAFGLREWFRTASRTKWISNFIYQERVSRANSNIERFFAEHVKIPQGVHRSKSIRYILYSCDMENTWCTMLTNAWRVRMAWRQRHELAVQCVAGGSVCIQFVRSVTR